MKIYDVSVAYQDRVFKYKRNGRFYVVGQNKKIIAKDAKAIFFKTLPEDCDYISDGKVTVIEMVEIPFITFGEWAHEYSIPIMGGYNYTGVAAIDTIIDRLTESDPSYTAIRKAIVTDYTTGMSYVLWYNGYANESSLKSIKRCLDREIDPYGY